MGKPMFEERSYERRQEILVRAGRGQQIDHWVKARIDSLTGKGAHVTLHNSSRGNKSIHVIWKDMKHLEDTAVAAEASSTFNNPVLTQEKMSSLRSVPAPVVEPPPVAPPLIATVTPIRPDSPSSTASIAAEQNLVKVTRTRVLRPATPTLIGGLLKNARTLENLSQQDVAELTGTNQVLISKIETGDKLPDDDLLISYVEHFALDLDLLLAARDRPEDALKQMVRPLPSPPVMHNPLPVVVLPPAPVAIKEEVMPVEEVKYRPAVEAPVLDIGDFFDFCDQMEAICPQPKEPALRKQWREFAQGLFNLRNKL